MTAAVVSLSLGLTALTVVVAIIGGSYLSLLERYLTAEDNRRRLVLDGDGLRAQVADLSKKVSLLETALNDCTKRLLDLQRRSIDEMLDDDLRVLVNGANGVPNENSNGANSSSSTKEPTMPNRTSAGESGGLSR